MGCRGAANLTSIVFISVVFAFSSLVLIGSMEIKGAVGQYGLGQGGHGVGQGPGQGAGEGPGQGPGDGTGVGTGQGPGIGLAPCLIIFKSRSTSRIKRSASLLT